MIALGCFHSTSSVIWKICGTKIVCEKFIGKLSFYFTMRLKCERNFLYPLFWRCWYFIYLLYRICVFVCCFSWVVLPIKPQPMKSFTDKISSKLHLPSFHSVLFTFIDNFHTTHGCQKSLSSYTPLGRCTGIVPFSMAKSHDHIGMKCNNGGVKDQSTAKCVLV